MIKTGSIVRPIAGRNQDRFFVVIQTDADCVLLSDGRRRKLQNGKSKNIWKTPVTHWIFSSSQPTNNSEKL